MGESVHVHDVASVVRERFFTKAVGGRHLLVCEAAAGSTDTKNTLDVFVGLYEKSRPRQTVAEKTIAWPESQLPRVSLQELPSLVLVLNGKAHSAQLPFRIPRPAPPRIVASTKFTLPDFTIAGLGTSQAIKAANPNAFNATIRQFIGNPSTENWNLLATASTTQRAQSGIVLREPLGNDDEVSLALEIASSPAVRVDTWRTLLGMSVFSISSLETIVRKLTEQSDTGVLLRAIIETPSIFVNDQTFVLLLKFILSEPKTDFNKLFSQLLQKSYTVPFLRQALNNHLTVEEAVEVADRTIDFMDNHETSAEVWHRAMEVLTTLIEGHCDNLIMRNEAYDTLKRAKEYVHVVTDMVSMFSKLMAKNKAGAELPHLNRPSDTDFLASTVQLIKLEDVQLK